MEMGAIEWGPVATWAGAIATVFTALVAILIAQGRFAGFRAPRMRITFGDEEPWCRIGESAAGGQVLWARVGVENVGRSTAHGCVGRLMGVTTNGRARADVDPVQLRWAGVPRSRSFDAVDLRPDQREFLNVLLLADGDGPWRIVTFEDPDFDPGFALDLEPDDVHVLQVAVFSDDAETATQSVLVKARADSPDLRRRLALSDNA